MILYQFDVQNVKTNVLIRRFTDQSFEKIKNRFKHQIKTLLSFDKLKIQSIDIKKKLKKFTKKLTCVEKISRANERNEICSKIRRRLKRSDSTSIEKDKYLFNYKNCFVKIEFFYKKNRMWISNFDHLKLNVIRQIHDQIIVKHFDYVRNYRFINQCYYWSRMNRIIKKYI